MLNRCRTEESHVNFFRQWWGHTIRLQSLLSPPPPPRPILHHSPPSPAQFCSFLPSLMSPAQKSLTTNQQFHLPLAALLLCLLTLRPSPHPHCPQDWNGSPNMDIKVHTNITHILPVQGLIVMEKEMFKVFDRPYKFWVYLSVMTQQRSNP